MWALGCCLYSLAFLQNCFEEGSNLAILSRKYTIPDDNPYGDGLVELIDRMLAVDYKARADMTEVILCLSAVYSGRPLPPRKKNTRSSKSDEKESSKKSVETTQKETIGKFRIDSQGYQENIYDPTKATEAKKLASNSVAARRKRAAASSSSSAVTSKISGGPSATIATATAAPTPVGLPSSKDSLTFSSIQGSEENNTSDVAFSSFGDLSREFSTSQSKGDVAFFQAFDNAKEGQKPKGNDGFDANAFGATGWDEKADGNGINKVQTSSTNKNDNLDSNGEKTKKDGSDNPRTKSRRKREGGGRSRANRDVEAGMETLKINNNDDAGAGAGASRRPRSSRGEEDKESRLRKRSGSSSKRKARGPRPSTTKAVDETGISGDDDEKKPSKQNNIRNIFNRKQGSQDP